LQITALKFDSLIGSGFLFALSPVLSFFIHLSAIGNPAHLSFKATLAKARNARRLASKRATAIRCGYQTALPTDTYVGVIKMPSQISVLLAYPRTLVAELVERALTHQPNLQVVARITTPEEILDPSLPENIDVALISARLGDDPAAGFEVLRQLRKTAPHVKVVMLFEQPDRDMVVTAFGGGARGVLCTGQCEFEMLCRCVKQVYAGQIWANSTELGWALETLTAMSSKPAHHDPLFGLAQLSKREEEVVRLLAGGNTNRKIANSLNLSEHTVKNYLFRIFDKLGVASRAELLVFTLNSAAKHSTNGSLSMRVNRIVLPQN
jgi:DNA-binding NarL/FixJ family response regulator